MTKNGLRAAPAVPAKSAATPSPIRRRSTRRASSACDRRAHIATAIGGQQHAQRASITGANVAPPVASQRPVRTVARCPRRRATSATRRDLPRPADPRITARRAPRRSRSRTSPSMRRSSSSRPTNGVAGAPRRRLERHHGDSRHRSGPALQGERAEGRQGPRVPTRRRVDSPTRTSPSCAAPGDAPPRSPDRRRDVGLVVANDDLAGVDRDPEVTPPPARPECSPTSVRKASCMRTAARTARMASSSATRGTPNAAITPSPRSLTTRPPVALITACVQRCVVAVHDVCAGGSRVEDALSGGRRAHQIGKHDGDDLARDTPGGTPDPSAAPHASRNCARPPRPRRRRLAQRVARGLPQLPQNRALAGLLSRSSSSPSCRADSLTRLHRTSADSRPPERVRLEQRRESERERMLASGP